MSTLKIKGNWNQQKSKLKQKFSILEDADIIYDIEEEIETLRTVEKKTSVKKKKKEWN
jgi:hypothetical protein